MGGGAWEEAGEEARALVARTPRHHQADESTTRGPGEHGSFPGQVGTGGGFHDQTHAARGARGARAAFLVRGAGGGSHVTVRHRHVTCARARGRPASGASVRLTPPTLARVRTYLALSAAACASGTLASSVRTRLSSAAAAAAERPAADSASAAAAASDCPEGAVPTRGAAGGRRGRRRRRRHQAHGAHTSAREARGQPPVARQQQQRSAQLAAPHHCSVRCWGLCASVRAGGTHLCVVVGPLERLAHGGVRHRA